MNQLQSAVGIFFLLAFAYIISENRRAIDWRSVGVAFAVTLIAAILLLKIPQLKFAFALVARAVDAIGEASRAGTSFVFGYVGGGPLPFELKTPGAEFVLAFQALPIVLIMSVLTTLLFYWRILPPIVRGFPGRSNGRSASAARSGFPPPPIFSSAWSSRRCSSAHISGGSHAANCSW